MMLPTEKSFHGVSYRNVYTCFPSQDLWDDLDLNQDEKDLVWDWVEKTSDINHHNDQKERVFQYGDTQSALLAFNKTAFKPMRFNTSAFGVWYGSLEEATSIRESLCWFYRHNQERLKDKNIVAHRKMFQANLETKRAVDLRMTDERTKLTDEDRTYTQKLGSYAKAMGIDMYLTPSARNKNGTCTPVFFPKAIKKDKVAYYLRFTLTPQQKLFYQKLSIAEPTHVNVQDFGMLPK